MSTLSLMRAAGREQRRDAGTVLIIGLLLLVVLGILGAAAMLMASLELRMAANFQHQAHAFEAAEFGIEQALHSPDLATGYTLANPKRVPAAGPAPLVPGSTSDTYRYLLYFDSSAGSTSVPGARAVGPGVAALHFIISATGLSSRGAEDVHTQSFYLLVPEECAAGGPGCAPLAAYAPIRSGWAQQEAE